ncbi:MAG TPA: nucleoside 2-deoxyribosyltransferase [Thermoanaerobaculia bacterium]|nr:nucleoside 2-deoxyribosyltransferase [Thermoanaerobaculia bacterium]
MGTTIYFSGSISGGRGDVAQYRRIIDVLEADGHRVLAGSVAAEDIGDGGDPLAAPAIFARDMAWIEEADVLVAEVSTPSTGVGYEIAAARYRYDIPVICLWRPLRSKRCSAMVAGDTAIRNIEYTDDTFDAMLARLRAALS